MALARLSLRTRGPTDSIYNTASVIDPRGEVVLRQRKLFPFRPYEVDVAAGTRAERIRHPRRRAGSA
jgi:predicted amidohydrolase